ncbi:MAG TPA: hypothetical protein VHO25_22040 [Polyangiaceae bacterium]|nr:hypothetical protein [Polyangiaceae bacterium]
MAYEVETVDAQILSEWKFLRIGCLDTATNGIVDAWLTADGKLKVEWVKRRMYQRKPLQVVPDAVLTKLRALESAK